MNHRNEVYGLIVESERELFPYARASDRQTDVVVRFTSLEVEPHGPGDAEIVLTYTHENVYYFCERRPDATYTLVFHGACEFEVSPALDEVLVRRHRGATPGIENVLASGALMALMLYLRNTLVLHASAVQLDGTAIAFTGGSGRGKSTMATIMCAAGARILTDDLLRVDFDEGVATTRLGSPELRLRKGADGLAASFAGSAPGRSSTADARDVIRPASLADDRVPLGAIYLPMPEAGASGIDIDRLTTSDALYVLLNSPRLFGWVDPGIRSSQFRLMSQLIAAVPFSFVHVPWGPPFDPSIASSIVADVGSQRAPRTLASVMASRSA